MSAAGRTQSQTPSQAKPSQNGSHLMSLGRAAIKHITRTKLCCCSLSSSPLVSPIWLSVVEKYQQFTQQMQPSHMWSVCTPWLVWQEGRLVATGKVQQQLLPAVNKHGFLLVPVPRPHTCRLLPSSGSGASQRRNDNKVYNLISIWQPEGNKVRQASTTTLLFMLYFFAQLP